VNKQDIDIDNMHGAIYNFPDQIFEAVGIGRQINLKKQITSLRNVIIVGMGGSAIGGDILCALVKDELKIPVFVSRQYSIPNWANEKTLVICSSYSGDTEETLSAYEDALQKGTEIIGITTGGKLMKRLDKERFDYIKIPGGLQPRAALAYSFIPMLFLMQNLGLISNRFCYNLESLIDLLNIKREVYGLVSSNNPTYSLAQQIYNKIPVIYGEANSTNIIAMRWKGQLCENAKMLAYHNELPELNHNEIVGWENNSDLFKYIALIWIKDKSHHDRVGIRQEITKKILNNSDISQHTVEVLEKNRMVRFLHLIHFGDWVSYWCAIAHETDPSPVAKIVQLKKELNIL
jgi:glucose/mannose-6-phosphate isomerase